MIDKMLHNRGSEWRKWFGIERDKKYAIFAKKRIRDFIKKGSYDKKD